MVEATENQVKEHERRFKHIMKSAGSQKEKFIATARALGCDESDDSYETLLKNVAVQKRENPSTKKSKKRNS
jgi:hypothetical protein